MTMIERVATAIEECGPVGCEVLGHKQALEMARAAIQAMREPTDRMKDAACAIAPDTNSGCFSYDNAEDVYEAMIDAALSETSEDKS